MPGRRAYSDECLPLDTQWDDIDITAIDLETTGVWHKSKIIEVGICKLRGDEIVERFEILVNPDEPIPADSTKCHGITDADVADAPTIDRLEGSIVWRLFDADAIVAHNLRFDIGFLRRAFGEAAIPKHTITLDTLTAARRLFKGRHGLAHTARHYGVEMGRHHRAFGDALACGLIARRMTHGRRLRQLNTGELRSH